MSSTKFYRTLIEANIVMIVVYFVAVFVVFVVNIIVVALPIVANVEFQGWDGGDGWGG